MTKIVRESARVCERERLMNGVKREERVARGGRRGREGNEVGRDGEKEQGWEDERVVEGGGVERDNPVVVLGYLSR